MVVTSLTFGNPLKFGQDSCHTTKGRHLPSSTERERAPEAPREPRKEDHSIHHIWEGPPIDPVRVGALPWWVVKRRLGGGFTVCPWSDVDICCLFLILPHYQQIVKVSNNQMLYILSLYKSQLTIKYFSKNYI